MWAGHELGVQNQFAIITREVDVGDWFKNHVKDIFIRDGSQEAQYYSTGKKFLIVYRIAAMSFSFASMVLYKIRALVKLYLKFNGIRIGVLIK